MTPRVLLTLLITAVRELLSNKVMRMAAALSYYAALSLVPLVIITLKITGSFVDSAAMQERFLAEAQAMVGEDGAELLRTVVEETREEEQQQPANSVLATLAGLLALAFGATAVFVELQDGLNVIWGVEQPPGRGLIGFVRGRLLSFAMVITLIFLLLMSLIVGAALAVVADHLFALTGAEGVVAQIGHTLVTLLGTSLLFALLFKLLPDARIVWRDVVFGALLTAGLFNVGEFLISQYLGGAGVGSAYGAAGSLLVILVWVFYSSLTVFLGAEFTQVHAAWRGREIQPRRGARMRVEPT